MLTPFPVFSRLLLGLMFLTFVPPYESLAAAGRPTSGEMSGAVSGFVWDPQARALRPVLGLPGASILGEDLRVGVDLADVAVAPDGNHALGITRDRLSVVEIRRLGAAITVHPLLRRAGPVDAVRFSRSGGEAVLYRRAANTYQLLTHLPNAPEAGAELDLPRSHGPLTAIAVADQGLHALAGFSDEESGAIYLLNARGYARLVSLVRHPSAIAFVNGGSSALVADRVDNKVYLLRNVAANVATMQLASRYEGVDGPVAVEVSGDSRHGFVANAASHTILTLDLTGGPPVVHSCPCVPAALRRLTGNSLFQLTGPSPGPMWLFDGDAPEPRVVFVPPYRHSVASGTQEK